MSYVTYPKSPRCLIFCLLFIMLFLWPSIVIAQPFADAVAEPVEAESGQTVSLDGSGSTGADYYEWSQVSGPSVDILNAYTAQASFLAPIVEARTELVLELMVWNESEQSDSDTVSIHVSPAENGFGPEADAGTDLYANQGETVFLDGRGSSGDGLLYAWTQLDADNGVDLQDETTAQPSFTAPDPGGEVKILSFQLTVTAGVDTDTDSVDVYIFPADAEIDTTPSGDPLGIRVDNTSVLDRFIITNSDVYTQTQTADGSGPVDLPHGLTDISLRPDSPLTGTSVFTSTVTFFLPTAAPPDHGWAKLNLQGNGTWIDFTDRVVFNLDRTVVSMTLNDNDLYDDNPTTGIIDDPSGLALFATGDDDDDDDGGDCFIVICLPR